MAAVEVDIDPTSIFPSPRFDRLFALPFPLSAGTRKKISLDFRESNALPPAVEKNVAVLLPSVPAG